MGNVNNPVINRWGFNQFWRTIWYNDKNYTSTLHQNHLFKKFIHLYLHYGIFHKLIVFSNRRWNPKEISNARKSLIVHNSQYFRKLLFTHPIFKEPSEYILRNKIKNIYPSRIWILCYQNWIVINFYFFQPIKRINVKEIPNYLSNNTNFFIKSKQKTNQPFRRIKFTLLYLFFKKKSSFNFYYKF